MGAMQMLSCEAHAQMQEGAPAPPPDTFLVDLQATFKPLVRMDMSCGRLPGRAALAKALPQTGCAAPCGKLLQAEGGYASGLQLVSLSLDKSKGSTS